tara:strand:- start:8452 stop:8844 length:393 start_codon:yes stop_codon:yes gene_type:complete
MTLNDPLANALAHILNCEKMGKSECIVRNTSKTIKKVLTLLHEMHYLGDFKEEDTGRDVLLRVNLIGAINKCGAIKPRFPVGKDNFEKFEKRYLPAKNFGLLVVSTPKGMMTQYQAIEKDMGGRLIAYCY